MRAADDLAGCSLVLATLATLSERRLSGDVTGIFTRAEEVGLVGATLVARSRTIPKSTTVISLEASRSRPIAQAGNGPVIRVGDFRSTFAWSAEMLLHAGVARLVERNSDFKVQRALMDGGTCEATAFGAMGYACTGIALPLGNYHNVPEGDGGLQAEFISRDDLTGAADLLLATVEAAGESLIDSVRARYAAVPGRQQSRLRRTAGAMHGGDSRNG
jgi:endoglucanase